MRSLSLRTFVLFAILIAGLAFVLVSPANANGSNATITSSKNPSMLGEAVTFTYSVPAVNAPSNPSAFLVNFYDGSTLLGIGTPNNSNGLLSASFTTSALTVGTHKISAVDPANGPSLLQVVNGPSEVPEADTLLLLGGGMGGLATWARWQWSKRRKQS